MTPDDLTADQVLDKMAKYCAYQERCCSDVVTKLNTFHLPEKDKKDIISYLSDNRFFDDTRFAKAFVRGKINQNGWGINKIRFQLIKKGIDKDIINEALAEVNEDNYKQRLKQILSSKKVKAENEFQAKQKLAAYAIQKGFEPALVWETIKEMDSEHET